MPGLSIEERVDPVRFQARIPMAIVNALTPPHELFRDLFDLDNVLFGLLTGPQVAIREVIDTMRSINGYSKKIVDIIEVIDSIAFQTNVLSLNAAVEAARAGEK